ncbi:MAG: lysophospholipid acyltransferase family protein [Acidobacteria bacterium]|nr:lysophospholipid acyltransferase family protein [Acidobacteriota bacterium]
MLRWLEYLLARGVLSSLAVGPPALARFYAGLLDRLVPRLRRIALRNLAVTGMPLQTADGVYESIARLLYGFARLPQINQSNVHQWIRYEGFEHFEEAKRRGKGVLFATGHLGNWELSAYAHALMTEPMYVVVRPLDNPRIDRLVEQRRSGSGNRIIGKKDLLRGVLKALAANEAVGILLDQNAGLDDGVFVDFFGLKASANVGFTKLAQRTGAAVIPGFAVWSPAERRYILRFYPIVEMTGDIVADTQSLQAALEAAIREYPDQWLWIHRRWKTRPPGEPPLY